jgi:hypothetical protein
MTHAHISDFDQGAVMDDAPIANLCSDAQLTAIVRPAPSKGRHIANRMFHALAE